MLELLNGERWQRWVPIPIRIILGAGFMVHGWAKWSRGPAAFAELLRQAHVPLPLANAWLVTLLEIFGGLALLMGAFVAIVSVPPILSMLGAMFTVNIKFGFSAVNTIGLTPAGPQLGPPGYEINLLYIACLVVLILAGAGPLSIDALRSRRRQQPLRRLSQRPSVGFRTCAALRRIARFYTNLTSSLTIRS
jgi:putative oxidoreductase